MTQMKAIFYRWVRKEEEEEADIEDSGRWMIFIFVLIICREYITRVLVGYLPLLHILLECSSLDKININFYILDEQTSLSVYTQSNLKLGTSNYEFN